MKLPLVKHVCMHQRDPRGWPVKDTCICVLRDSLQHVLLYTTGLDVSVRYFLPVVALFLANSLPDQAVKYRNGRVCLRFLYTSDVTFGRGIVTIATIEMQL